MHPYLVTLIAAPHSLGSFPTFALAVEAAERSGYAANVFDGADARVAQWFPLGGLVVDSGLAFGSPARAEIAAWVCR